VAEQVIQRTGRIEFHRRVSGMLAGVGGGQGGYGGAGGGG
jgi:hypothetical protein